MKRIFSFFICLFLILGLVPFAAHEAEAVFEGDDKIVILIDPGHGGANVGTSRNGIGEKYKTFELGNLLKQKLEANGNFIVHMTRTGDYDLPLAARGIYANTVNADLLVSLHFDGSLAKGDNGISVITSVLPEYEMVDLAYMVCNSLSAKTGIGIKGVIQRKDNAGYYWNKEKQWDCEDPSLGTLSDYYGIPTWCAKFGIGSILIEHGFFTNDYDASIIFSEGMMDKMAEADAEAIINYYTNHTHTYTSDYIQDFPSNCVFQGKKSIHCTTCGHRKNITSLEAAPDNHYWVNEKTTSASCGVDGVLYRECRITLNLNDKDVPIEDHIESKTIEAKPHEYEIGERVEATHTVDGYIVFVCSNCKSSYKEIYAAEGHKWTLVDEIGPKCTQKGVKTYKCDGCDETYTEEQAALGHSYNVSEIVEPTCTEKGSRVQRCTACGDETTEPIEAKGHSFDNGVIYEPSCTEDMIRTYTCKECGFEEEETVKPTGHTFSKKEMQKLSCTEEVTIVSVCTACKLETEETFAPTGHDFNTRIIKKNTCTDDGEELGTCKKCGYKETTVIEKTGHTFDVEVVKENTCTEDGEEVRTCSVCEYVETVFVGKTGHNMVLETNCKPTCVNNGYVLKVCSECDYQEKDEKLATGHVFVTEITAEASMFTRGAKLTSCSNCGEYYREVIPSAWDSDSTKAIIIGCSALVLAAVFTVVIFHMKKREERKKELDAIRERAEADVAAITENAEKIQFAEQIEMFEDLPSEEAEADEAEVEEPEESVEAEETEETEKSEEAEEAEKAVEAEDEKEPEPVA